MRPDMLYMIGKIFLKRVFHKLAHENMTNFEKLFSAAFIKKISIFFKQRRWYMKLCCMVIHTSIYQVGPFKFKLLVKKLHNG